MTREDARLILLVYAVVAAFGVLAVLAPVVAGWVVVAIAVVWVVVHICRLARAAL